MRNTFIAEKTLGEFRIVLADIVVTSDCPCATEELGFQPIPAGASFQQTIHKKFHQVDAETFGLSCFGSRVRAGKKKVIDAADACQRIAYARRDA
jgi:hypothetical protein